MSCPCIPDPSAEDLSPPSAPPSCPSSFTVPSGGTGGTVTSGNGKPNTVADQGTLYVQLDADCASLWANLSVGSAGSEWVRTAGGGINTQVGTYIFTEDDYTKLVRFDPDTGPDVWTLPTTEPLDGCWHAFLYNDSSASVPSTLRLDLEDGSTPQLFGYVFVGGGGVVFSEGDGSYRSWAVEQYRSTKEIDSASYTILASDENLLLRFTYADGCDVSVPQSTESGDFPSAFRLAVVNDCAAGNVVLTPAAGTLNGLPEIEIQTRCSAELVADGTNWNIERGWAPTGVTEHDTTPQTINASWHGRINVYTGDGSGEFEEPDPLPVGMLFSIANAADTAGETLSYVHTDGTKDTLRRGDSFLLYAPASGDAGTTAFGVFGVMRAGGRVISGNDSVTRDDNHRCLELGGTGGTLTFFEINDAVENWDTQFKVTVKNNGTGTWTLTPTNADTFNGAATFRLDPCQGVDVYAVAAAKWVVVTGASCFQTGTGTPNHQSPEGTPYWDTSAEELWVNNNGATSWTKVSGGGFSLTVEEDGATGLPDEVTNVDTLQFEGDSFDVTNPGAGVAKVDPRFGTDVQSTGTANAGGSSATFARSDHVHNWPGVGVHTETSGGTVYTRRKLVFDVASSDPGFYHFSFIETDDSINDRVQVTLSTTLDQVTQVRGNSSQTVTSSSTDVKVEWDNPPIKDTLNAFDSGTPDQLTIGFGIADYAITLNLVGSLGTDGSPAEDEVISCELKVNGSTIPGCGAATQQKRGLVTDIDFHMATEWSLTTDDVITVEISNFSTKTLTIDDAYLTVRLIPGTRSS